MVGRRVAVVGDAMLDAYLMGNVLRISPEAPVPVFQVQREERFLGGAANVAKCLVALGAKVRLCACVGRDSDGDVFLDEARGLKIDVAGVVRDASRPTTLKSRVVAKHQQMLRIDREQAAHLSKALEARLVRKVRQAVAWADVVILSDYSKGVLTEGLCRSAIAAAGRKPVVVDPKEYSWWNYRGATVLKPNRRDAQVFASAQADDDAGAERVAKEILKKVGVKHVLLTRGEQGMTLASRGSKNGAVHFASRPREVFDVTGAGDVVISTLALALASGADVARAAWLANAAAGVKVGKFGTATVSDEEVLEALGASAAAPDFERKVMSRKDAAGLAASLRKQRKKVVFTNGCFDILHFGHVSYLERSRRLGDALIVGVNSDTSVRRLKGEGRPVQHEFDRARILAAQACVDAVVIFDEDTPLELIKSVRPDVLCKGSDYKQKRHVVGWNLVEDWGGRVALVEIVAGRSTTGLLRKAAR
ncbi:MAG: D-glycero-beta-D-manno-heptose 1-phosphate adenylyltransferase [Planctomycetes bacterium]|nr:D-glycero-beta-D-manno-heptose 1-phosphate adenylyltransferase [Planctomycetota bacterium]